MVELAFELIEIYEVVFFVAFVELAEDLGSIKFIYETSTVRSQYYVIAMALTGPYLVSKTTLYLIPWTI